MIWFHFGLPHLGMIATRPAREARVELPSWADMGQPAEQNRDERYYCQELEQDMSFAARDHFFPPFGSVSEIMKSAGFSKPTCEYCVIVA
jgi:hypothetical protein